MQDTPTSSTPTSSEGRQSSYTPRFNPSSRPDSSGSSSTGTNRYDSGPRSESGSTEDKPSTGDDNYSQDGSRTGKGRYRPRTTRLPFKKKFCFFTRNHITYIDYKDTLLLKRFLGRSGQILSPRITGVKPIYQRKLALAVKRARYMSLIPFVGEVVREDMRPPREFNDEYPNSYNKENNRYNKDDNRYSRDDNRLGRDDNRDNRYSNNNENYRPRTPRDGDAPTSPKPSTPTESKSVETPSTQTNPTPSETTS